MRICIDLDGTILEFSWDRWEKEGQKYWDVPKDKAVETLHILRAMGHYLVIYTSRILTEINPGYTRQELIENVEHALKRYNIPYDEIWTEKGKPIADLYIDDRGYRFENWEDTLRFILEKEGGCHEK